MAENAANIRNWAFLSPSHSPGTSPRMLPYGHALPGYYGTFLAVEGSRLPAALG